MCVIIYKPAGKEIPEKSILEMAFETNPDGAGYMLTYKGDVVFRKGFMTFESFYDDFVQYTDSHNINTTKTPIAFHFRITTQGGVQQGLTHPFPVCDNYADMRELEGTCKIALMHNGIIDLTSESEYSYSGGYWDKKTHKWVNNKKKKLLDHNDTMKFAKDILRPIIDGNMAWTKNKDKCNLVEFLAESSRLCIMHANGFVKLLGEWVRNDGLYYSNDLLFRPYNYGYWYGWDDEYGETTPTTPVASTMLASDGDVEVVSEQDDWDEYLASETSKNWKRTN